VQGAAEITPAAFIANSISLAGALKDQFPGLTVFGPVNYGFEGLYNWQGGMTATPGGHDWFADAYLTAMKTASVARGAPVVDVYDFHWYSQVSDGNGGMITDLNGASLTDAQVQAIVQSPRSLWDPSYRENSWIANDVLGGPIYILGRLQSRIAAENPGMKLSLTEYNNGGAGHIAGTIAEADNLGIFGSHGVFAANLWPLTGTEPYIVGGFRAFRDFDGAGANFGDTSTGAVSSDVAAVAVYASTDSARPGRAVFVAINRSTSAQVTAIDGQPLTGTAHLYRMTAATAAAQTVVQPVAAGTQAVSGASLIVTLPPLSVTTIDVH
jgi:hypothetical protein